jgi:hypothetical protein
MMGISFFQAQVEELTTFQALRLRDFCRNERNEREMSAPFITMPFCTETTRGLMSVYAVKQEHSKKKLRKEYAAAIK